VTESVARLVAFGAQAVFLLLDVMDTRLRLRGGESLRELKGCRRPSAGPAAVMRTRTWHPASGDGEARTRCRATTTEGPMGAGNCRSFARFVNRSVNRTLRDSMGRGRRSRRSETGSVLSAEVTAPARDGLRRQRHTSYGS
jgi:hypothetical protein